MLSILDLSDLANALHCCIISSFHTVDDTRSFFVDIVHVNQDQTAQNVQSDLCSTLSMFFILDYNLTFFFAMEMNF